MKEKDKQKSHNDKQSVWVETGVRVYGTRDEIDKVIDGHYPTFLELVERGDFEFDDSELHIADNYYNEQYLPEAIRYVQEKMSERYIESPTAYSSVEEFDAAIISLMDRYGREKCFLANGWWRGVITEDELIKSVLNEV